ncbi:MAG: GDP-mannose 4,6-dehydratase [Planctomycetota bacterium]|jgi:UDP-glucuronate 4-epimerase
MGSLLVTGGAGFIGSHLAAALLERGDRVVSLDNLDDFYDPAVKRGNLARLARQDGFLAVEGDIRDRETVRRVLADHGVEDVVHLAAMAGVRPSLERPAHYADVNVRGTALLMEEAAASGVRRFVFASSSSVYGERKDPPFRESDRVDRPLSPYAATKKAGELMAHGFHHATGISVTCLRYFTVYGPRQRPEMAIHRFGRLIREGKPIPMFGDGSSARDYTWIGDIVDGTVRALDRCEGYRIYNLGGSKTITLRNLVEMLSRELGREALIDQQPFQKGDVSLTSACVDLAERDLGYRPSVSIEEGIRRFVTWLRGQEE